MKYLRGILLPALLALAPFAVAKDEPTVVSAHEFDSEVFNIFYFDDSDVAILSEMSSSKVYRSKDAGKSWEEVEGLRTLGLMRNPFDNKVAVALGDKRHWITYDQGESWQKFETEYGPSITGPPISFHAKDSKKLLYHTIEDCYTTPCLGQTLLTTDGFKSNPKPIVDDRKMCLWAKSSERFLKDDDKHDDRILCITRGKYSDRSKDNRLLMSDDFFKTSQEPTMSSGRTVQGMTNMASVKGYFVAAAKSDNSNELSLYVTNDTESWHHARFGDGKIEEDAYTILESTNYSIQVDVMTSKFAFVGSLYTSNSDGTHFTRNIDHTNRNDMGYVDFEKISNIQGIVIVNVVKNWKEAENPFQKKQLVSQISFDDGRTFDPLKVKGKDDKLHLHSVTNLRNSGRVFSSPAPGIVMGVGNTGETLGKYSDGDLWVSDDAGLTWEFALEGAHKYEFGDQGAVLVAVRDDGDTDEIWYSLKHGGKDTWKSVKLDYKIRARELTTVSDSTSLKFILYASKIEKSRGRKHVIIHIDFSDMHERKCDDKDFDDWSPRKNEGGKPEAMCVMGHKQIFRRRKWDADCFVEQDFKDPVPRFELCDCNADTDYECDYGFSKNDDGKCEPSGPLTLPPGACKSGDDKYKGSSGWRRIPGNQCKGSTWKDEQIDRPCNEDVAPPSSGKISHKMTTFKGSNFREYYYLERSTQHDDDEEDKNKDKDETVVMLTDEKEAYITHDHGKEWEIAVKDSIVAIYPHQYNNDHVYFLTATKKVYYSTDRGLRDSIHEFEAPQMPNTHQLQILQFHPKQSDWIIWIGGEHCERMNDRECHTEASVSQHHGKSWEPLLSYVKKCAFVWREAGRHTNEQAVFCEQYTNEEMGAAVELLSSEDWFKTKDVKFKSVVEFATMSEFIIVATKDDDGKSLKLDASLDAKEFAEAKFPPKFQVDHQTAYTVLDSSTHSVFLHVTVNGRVDQEYGSIIKSNSNGTFYVMSLSYVNRNTAGYVDFEKMQGIEGVALANVVANHEQVDAGGAKKRKQTKITHNDGADWEFLKAPEKDSDNKPYNCDGCTLHLHGYTERPDPRETFSSPTAVGIVMGIGNVGKELTTIGEASTFITTDAGITWREVKKGAYTWEFGDQGSVIVIVRRGQDTDHLYYSLDMGGTWDLYRFADHALRIDAISTVPSDTSLNFLLWGRNGKELVTINVDFSGLPQFEKKCSLDENNPKAGDYDLWTPQHPLQEDQECLFGHVAQYHRKRSDRQCRNGQRIDDLHAIVRNCSCTRRDFECDYNFERMPGGECKKIEGLTLPDPKEVCNQGAIEYWDITGYRKIPISTCSGGKDLEHTSSVHPCPNRQEEFDRKHGGMGGFGIFMAVVVPFMAAGGIGYYVWRHWDGKFGRIRLGDGGGSGFDSDSPWVRWPVAAISGLVAVVAALPLLVGSLWRMVAGRFGGYGGRTYTSRSSFARGRGDYAVVDPDEGELLGEDSDEDV